MIITNNSCGFDGVDSIQEAVHVPWTIMDKSLLVIISFL